MRDLSYRALVSIAVSAGAATPVPSVTGAWAWSTTEDRPLFWDGTVWKPASGNVYVDKSADFTAVVNGSYWILADSITATLPASPGDNDFVILASGTDITSGTTTIARNGNTILGVAQDMIIDTNSTSFSVKLVFRATSGDWRLAL